MAVGCPTSEGASRSVKSSAGVELSSESLPAVGMRGGEAVGGVGGGTGAVGCSTSEEDPPRSAASVGPSAKLSPRLTESSVAR